MGPEAPNNGKYAVLASEPSYSHLNGREVQLSPNIHRTIFQAHALLAIATLQVIPSEEMVGIISGKRWSPERVAQLSIPNPTDPPPDQEVSYDDE